MAVLFRTHREQCETCGAYLKGINGGQPAESIPDPPSGIEEHIAELLEALPPGEAPTLP
jgi:hypothetical protein